MKRYIRVFLFAMVAMMMVVVSSCSKSDEESETDEVFPEVKREDPQSYDVKIDGVFYVLVSKAQIALVSGGDTYYTGHINIPSTIKHEGVQYTVTAIAHGAFSCCRNLLSVTIPNSVKDIGEDTFHECTRLRKLILPEELDILPSAMCFACSELSEVKWPSRLRKIGNVAFWECVSLVSVSLPEGLEEIESNAFSYSS